MTAERDIGRLEGKMDLVINMMSEVKETGEARVKKLHERVDLAFDNISELKSADESIKKDVKWVILIGLAIVSAVKFVASKAIILFK